MADMGKKGDPVIFIGKRDGDHVAIEPLAKVEARLADSEHRSALRSVDRTLCGAIHGGRVCEVWQRD